MRLLLGLSACVLLASGCGANRLVVDLDRGRGDLRDPEPVPAGIRIAGVDDERDVRATWLGEARDGDRVMEVRSDRPVDGLVRDVLASMLEDGPKGPSVYVKVEIEECEVREPSPRNLEALVALRFTIADPPRDILTRRTTRIDVGDELDQDVRDVVFSALEGCAQDLVDQLASGPGLPEPDDPILESGPVPEPRQLVGLGIGTSAGGIGFILERHFGDTRMHAITAGIGAATLGEAEYRDYGHVLAWKIGYRRYLDGGKHRLFLAASAGPVAWMYRVHGTVGNVDYDVERVDYGGGAGFGYKYTAYNGFTFLADQMLLFDPRRGSVHLSPTLALGRSF